MRLRAPAMWQSFRKLVYPGLFMKMCAAGGTTNRNSYFKVTTQKAK